ncbi:hypothetical protein NLX86_20205 [Streptomyces sp. A3M-1-3]|uniref:hypothetical protein n=1 Tax=Streptomyces sp. A3M-1-3 TaxID=2962044 RepID=UPI0020B77038|nr:hypothetical protein [Streptomyces sp. A3M-1-3]MCP3820335.1 hypothetical protein [Streptomyces sp. A3M-1-3]
MTRERTKELTAAAQAQATDQPPPPPGHGYAGPIHSKVKGGAHTKPDLKRAGSPKGDRIGERTKGLS